MVRLGPACDQIAAISSRLAIQQNPLLRSSPCMFSSAVLRRCGWNGRSERKVMLLMPYSSVSGVCPSAISSSQPGVWAARSGSNNPVCSTRSRSTTPAVDRTIVAVGLSRRSRVSTIPSVRSFTRSTLLRIRTSANSTWSVSRSAMERPSPFAAAISRSASDSPRASSGRKVDASTTVTMVSSRATCPRLVPSSNSQVNDAATGMGSEIPVDSITSWSNRFCRARFPTASIRSSRKVQQMQPLVSSTSRSSVRSRWPVPATRAASMFTSLISLTITATRRPSVLARMWLSRVVFPAPRNPESTVTGRSWAVVT
ncbi:Uncharacterised protein [Mycobacteroides abscessus subsp. abscessus]|nr:Uncharacterised protein [Mycobacteroides abscessus subsp. abscessus]